MIAENAVVLADPSEFARKSKVIIACERMRIGEYLFPSAIVKDHVTEHGKVPRVEAGFCHEFNGDPFPREFRDGSDLGRNDRFFVLFFISRTFGSDKRGRPHFFSWRSTAEVDNF